MRRPAGRVNAGVARRSSADNRAGYRSKVTRYVHARRFSPCSYSRRMKTSISIPDRLFEEAERLAAQRRMSRSELYTQAVALFIESQKGIGVRERLDAVYSAHPDDSELEPALTQLQSQSLLRR